MCAVMKQGILGGLKGKVGPTIGTSWKGIPVLKAMPVSVANPRTPAQVIQRLRFATMSSWASSILTVVIKPFWDKFAIKESGFNAFMHTNLPMVSDTGVIDYQNIKIALGNLAVLPNIMTETLPGQELDFAWSYVAGQGDDPTDLVSVFVYNVEQDRWFVQLNAAERDALGVLVQLPSAWSNATLYNYLIVANADRSKVNGMFANMNVLP